MSQDAKVYKKVELVGASDEGVDDAIRTAIQRASKTIRNMNWFEVKEIRGSIDGENVGQFQVTLQVGFRLDEGAAE